MRRDYVALAVGKVLNCSKVFFNERTSEMFGFKDDDASGHTHLQVELHYKKLDQMQNLRIGLRGLRR